MKASRLLPCCDERMAYHDERKGWWAAQRAAAESKIKNGGITIEHMPTSYSQGRSEVRIDATLSSRILECERKIEEHRQAFNRFRSYRSLLKLAGDTEVDLAVDDVLFFNLEDADDGSED